MTTFRDQSIDPVMRLVLAAIQVSESPKAFGRIFTDIELSRAFELARRHGISALFYMFMRGQESALSSYAILKRHSKVYLGNVGRNMQVTQNMIHLLDLLKEKGIPAIPFKGPVIAVQAYGDIGLRSFCDIDLLIRPGDFHRVYELMESAGYQSLKSIIADMKSVWSRTRRNFEFQKGNLLIDFHQQVTTGPGFLELKVQWDKLSSVDLNGREVPCLCLEDTILMLAMHGTHHGWNILKYVADFAHLVHTHKDEINWEKLERKARKMGVLRMVLIGIYLGHDFCGLAVPPRIKENIIKDRIADKLVAYFKSRVMAPQKSGLIPQTALPRSMDTWRHQLRYLSYYIFTPTNLDLLSIRLPMFFYPLYFIMRPIRLVSNLVRGRKVS